MSNILNISGRQKVRSCVRKRRFRRHSMLIDIKSKLDIHEEVLKFLQTFPRFYITSKLLLVLLFGGEKHSIKLGMKANLSFMGSDFWSLVKCSSGDVMYTILPKELRKPPHP